MPSSDLLDESEYNCPKCYETETYVHKETEMFLCSECDYERPIKKVAQTLLKTSFERSKVAGLKTTITMPSSDALSICVTIRPEVS